MRAIFLTGPAQLEVREVPGPALRHPTEVLIKVGLAGICGSDLHYFQDGRIGSAKVQYPFLIGHECAGTVVAAGEAVDRLQPGDRVAVDPAIVCHQCDQCRAGRSHTCRGLRFLGCPGEANGCYSDYLVMPEENLNRLPASTSLELGLLCEPLAISWYALQQAHLPPAIPLDAAILGSGPIGLTLLIVAQALTQARMAVTDRVPHRLELARQFGADWIGNPDEREIVEELKGHYPAGLDVVFECAGQQSTLDQALELLKPGGKMVIVGIPREDRVHFRIDLLRRKEITIINVRRQNNCMPAAVDFVARYPRPEALQSLVTHYFSPSQAQAAFQLTEAYRDGVLKSVFKFD